MKSWSITHINFSEILPVWRDQLWPGRESKIEPQSAIDEDGSINMELMKAIPVFLACKDQDKIVGVVSGYKTSNEKFRSRGLWVSPDLRGQGLGYALIDELKKEATLAGCRAIWTMARFDAWPFYQKAGFQKKSETDKYEFGPHIICEKTW